MSKNVSDLTEVALRQRVLRDVSQIDLSTTLFRHKQAMPVVLAARRHLRDVRASRRIAGSPSCLQRRRAFHSVDGIDLLDRGSRERLSGADLVSAVCDPRSRFHAGNVDSSKEAGASALVFTVDMPVPGARYRDAHSGMSGSNATLWRTLQAMGKPAWAWDVGLFGRPHTLGNLKSVLGGKSGLGDYVGWLGAEFRSFDSLDRSRLVARSLGRSADHQRHPRSGRCARGGGAGCGRHRRLQSWRTAARRRVVVGSRIACDCRSSEGQDHDSRGLRSALRSRCGATDGLGRGRCDAGRAWATRSPRMGAPGSSSCSRFSRRKCEWRWHSPAYAR